MVELDNNATERSLRGPVVGRKNHYGSHSERDAQVAATLFTVFETAKLSGVEQASYLRQVVDNELANPGSVTLPSHLTPAQP